MIQCRLCGQKRGESPSLVLRKGRRTRKKIRFTDDIGDASKQAEVSYFESKKEKDSLLLLLEG